MEGKKKIVLPCFRKHKREKRIAKIITENQYAMVQAVVQNKDLTYTYEKKFSQYGVPLLLFDESFYIEASEQEFIDLCKEYTQFSDELKKHL